MYGFCCVNGKVSNIDLWNANHLGALQGTRNESRIEMECRMLLDYYEQSR